MAVKPRRFFFLDDSDSRHRRAPRRSRSKRESATSASLDPVDNTRHDLVKIASSTENDEEKLKQRQRERRSLVMSLVGLQLRGKDVPDSSFNEGLNITPCSSRRRQKNSTARERKRCKARSQASTEKSPSDDFYENPTEICVEPSEAQSNSADKCAISSSVEGSNMLAISDSVNEQRQYRCCLECLLVLMAAGEIPTADCQSCLHSQSSPQSPRMKRYELARDPLFLLVGPGIAPNKTSNADKLKADFPVSNDTLSNSPQDDVPADADSNSFSCVSGTQIHVDKQLFEHLEQYLDATIHRSDPNSRVRLPADEKLYHEILGVLRSSPVLWCSYVYEVTVSLCLAGSRPAEDLLSAQQKLVVSLNKRLEDVAAGSEPLGEDVVFTFQMCLISVNSSCVFALVRQLKHQQRLDSKNHDLCWQLSIALALALNLEWFSFFVGSSSRRYADASGSLAQLDELSDVTLDFMINGVNRLPQLTLWINFSGLIMTVVFMESTDPGACVSNYTDMCGRFLQRVVRIMDFMGIADDRDVFMDLLSSIVWHDESATFKFFDVAWDLIRHARSRL